MTDSADAPDVLERFHGSLDLVDIVAKQLVRKLGSHSSLDELVSFGREGLLDAARRFDAERGVPFRAYANYRVKGAIIDGVRRQSALPRRVYERLRAVEAATHVAEGAAEDTFGTASRGREQAQAALGQHLASVATAVATGLLTQTAPGEDGELTGVDPSRSPEEATEQAELLKLVTDALATLPEQEALLVRRHYFEGERFDNVAAELGLSKSWASRLHTRAIERLTKRLRSAT